MSWLTVVLRGIGGGPILDAIEAAEAKPSAATIGAAITTTLQTAPTVVENAPMAIVDLGTLVGQTVIGAAQKLNPGLGAVAANIVPSLLQDIETLVLTHLDRVAPAPAPQARMDPIPD